MGGLVAIDSNSTPILDQTNAPTNSSRVRTALQRRFRKHLIQNLNKNHTAKSNLCLLGSLYHVHGPLAAFGSIYILHRCLLKTVPLSNLSTWEFPQYLSHSSDLQTMKKCKEHQESHMKGEVCRTSESRSTDSHMDELDFEELFCSDVNIFPSQEPPCWFRTRWRRWRNEPLQQWTEQRKKRQSGAQNMTNFCSAQIPKIPKLNAKISD